MRVLASLVVTVLALPAAADPDPHVTVSGYGELYYALHAQDPSNHQIALRAFDIRSHSFGLSNAVLAATGEGGPLTAKLALQIGDTPTTYYASEPAWRYLQQANVSARAPHGYVIEAGLFLSPIGPEVMPIKDNWNWSRSNLFYGLPFYHLGATVSHALGPWTAKLHVYNGWNQIIDGNSHTSVAASAAYARGTTSGQVLYFGGVERPAGAAEGQHWRHLVDGYVQAAVTDEVALQAHVDAGLEKTAFGTSSWAGVAGYAKFQVTRQLFAATRADYFREHSPTGATPIFWPVRWVAEGTLTLAYQPIDRVSVRAEYRHDQAAGAVYFGGPVTTDATTLRDIPNRDAQDTFTLGATAWF